MAGWVCPECGIDYDTVSPPDAVVALRGYPRRFGEQLGKVLERDNGDALVRTRPEPTVWSAVEYTAHVADLMDVMAATFDAMREGRPTLGLFWDPDKRAETEHYNDWPLDDLKSRLHAGCDGAADATAKTGPDDWKRESTFEWGDRDLLTMIRNAVHEGHHHLRDVEQVLAKVG